VKSTSDIHRIWVPPIGRETLNFSGMVAEAVIVEKILGVEVPRAFYRSASRINRG